MQTHGLVRSPIINSALPTLNQEGPGAELDPQVVEVGIDDEEGESGSWDEGEEADEDDELEAGATVLRGFQPGWTLVDRLYIYNGSFYVVTWVLRSRKGPHADERASGHNETTGRNCA